MKKKKKNFLLDRTSSTEGTISLDFKNTPPLKKIDCTELDFYILLNDK